MDYVELRYLKKAEEYVLTGKTPMRCHALHLSVFIDSWGDVYPWGMYDAKIASLRDHTVLRSGDSGFDSRPGAPLSERARRPARSRRA